MIKTGYQVIYKCDENPPWRSPEITLLPSDGEVVARYFPPPEEISNAHHREHDPAHSIQVEQAIPINVFPEISAT